MVPVGGNGGNRGERTSRVAEYGFCGLAVFGVAVLIWFLGSLNGHQAEQRYSQPHRHAIAAKDQALERCASTNGTALVECLYDRIEASEETARTEEDLTAQQRAAWAAMAAALFAFVSIPVGIGGLWALLKSLRHTEQAIAVSVHAMEETRNANTQARKQAKAVLYTKDCYFELAYERALKSISCRVVFNVENVGDTPAQRVTFKLGVHLLNKRKRLGVSSKNHFIGIVRAQSAQDTEVKFTIKDRAVFDQNLQKFNRILVTFDRTFMDVFDDRSEEKYALISPISRKPNGVFQGDDFTFCDRNFVAVIKDVPLKRTA